MKIKRKPFKNYNLEVDVFSHVESLIDIEEQTN